MIESSTHTLSNGIRVVHHHDRTTRMVAVNVLVDVGSRDETPPHTGLAHLMEHLMFGGSANISQFDDELQAAGGESNAWTSDDVTNFYDILPAHNIETAFWLESDRLRELSFTPKSFETQRSVVIEEFKQRCLNQPYGDIGHIVRQGAFTEHPYRWPVIGANVADVEGCSLDVVKDFYYRHYCPNRIVVGIAGAVDSDTAFRLAEKWLADIPTRRSEPRKLPNEPKQIHQRLITVNREVPQNIIVKAYHMCGRNDDDYYATDLLSDVLANGNSARFMRNILMTTDLFTDLDASIWGSIDPGLLVIKGKLQHGVTFDQANSAIDAELARLVADGVSQREVDTMAAKAESNDLAENINYSQKAVKLCWHMLLSGKADNINNTAKNYQAVTAEHVQRIASRIIRPGNETRLYYGPKILTD